MTNSIISNNTALGGGGGGILNVANGSATTTILTVLDSTIVRNSSNFGGGLANVNFQATSTLTNCTVDSNFAYFFRRRRIQLVWRGDADQLQRRRQLRWLLRRDDPTTSMA